MSRWHSCNILQTGATSRRVWQFDVRKAELGAGREQAIAAGQSLPMSVGKNWTSLWQPKLNVAWLPAEKVFLRVTQLPVADLAETRTMVEFQLEKLSPLPVTQVVWSIHVLPSQKPAMFAAAPTDEKKKDNTQTVIVVIVPRHIVEEFLGALEKDGFLADRLEVPLIDQLSGTEVHGDGAWIYLPEDSASKTSLVAWWHGGVLQNLGFIQLPADKNDTATLRDQLQQMTWAGELEGWLTTAPRWNLVAGNAAAAWQGAFNAATGQTVSVVAPPAPAQLAAATARRAALSEDSANILPAEYAARYRQQFVDGLWMRGLFTVLAIYGAGVLIYFVALGFLTYQTSGVEKQVAGISLDYTNSVQLKARYLVLKDRQDLKYAALDCWKKTAELMPPGATLNALDFRDGKKLLLNGNAASDDATAILEFNSALQKIEVNGQPFFSKVESPTFNQNPANNTLTWSFSAELNHTEESP
jgi:hypothetical protein